MSVRRRRRRVDNFGRVCIDMNKVPERLPEAFYWRPANFPVAAVAAAAAAAAAGQGTIWPDERGVDGFGPVAAAAAALSAAIGESPPPIMWPSNTRKTKSSSSSSSSSSNKLN